jgi:hypothetical protein
VDLQISTAPVIVSETRLADGQIAPSAWGVPDGFLQKILPPDGIQAPFELGIGWRCDAGVYLVGSGGFEVQLPVSVDLLGILEVTAVYISREFDSSGAQGKLTCSAAALLGPLKADVDQVGASVRLHTAPQGGNLGPLSMQVGFQPPKGVGLSLNAGVVQGGGYICIGSDRGESGAPVARRSIPAIAIGVNVENRVTSRDPFGSFSTRST